MKPALKVCGMKHNIEAVAALDPQYLGFIFYEKSPRYFLGELPPLPEHIKKVGVFVNASISEVIALTKKYQLAVCQLHGDESVSYLQQLRKTLPKPVALWKVFAVDTTFDFSALSKYEAVADAFLFDTKGKERGGNGIRFSWDILKNYKSSKPFILSGGIGPEHLQELQQLLSLDLPIMAVDVNSKFETAPGNKNVQQLKEFSDAISRR
ncbi:MAG: N-(5'-phosphoribosyl)anthranilate isomerase [Flavobacteriaceae bacterium]|nr:N-(5'-phosphoribosyl)anthranilate isomerase [Flavobacteriaceae bacterium]|tara:strand:- start:2306 stop:2932 length:627 start_codon:yes stop_codon:yes gene_type:complete